LFTSTRQVIRWEGRVLQYVERDVNPHTIYISLITAQYHRGMWLLSLDHLVLLTSSTVLAVAVQTKTLHTAPLVSSN